VIKFAAVVAAAGLILIALGVLEASPLVFFGTEDERESIDKGRDMAVDGAVVVALACAALALVGAQLSALLVAIAAAVPVGLVLLWGDSAFGLLSLALWLVLLPLAVVRRTSTPAG
jgi:hypothetical protein